MKRKTKKTRLNSFLLLGAVALLLFAGIGSARSAYIESDKYETQIATKNIDLAINENGDPVGEDGALLTGMLKEDETLKIGQMYPESLSVTNTGDIDQYVRVTVYKYWTDADGKRLDLSPEYIDLKETTGWTKAKGSNEEYSIYYLTNPLKTGETKALFKGFRINEAVKTEGKKIMIGSKEYDSDKAAAAAAGDGDVITYTYTYDGCKFNVEAEAQSVQTHNSAEAIKSLWGVDAKAFGIKLVD